MRVVIRVHSTGMPDLAAWRRRIIQSKTGGAAMADLLWEELLRELVRTGGVPVRATGNPLTNPSDWIWRFSSDAEVRYELFREPPTWFRQEIRTITIRSIRTVP